jgi:hypothetical protein
MQARGAQMQADAVAYAGLQSALRPNLELATAGVIDGVQRQAIDPLAHTRDLAPISVRGLSNAGSNGKPHPLGGSSNLEVMYGMYWSQVIHSASAR